MSEMTAFDWIGAYFLVSLVASLFIGRFIEVGPGSQRETKLITIGTEPKD